jgi:hypothetical protein
LKSRPPDGKPTNSIPGGVATAKGTELARTREKNAPISLAPQAIDDAYVAYNLRDIFDTRTPGTYNIAYIYQNAKDDPPVKSNELRVVVKAAAK